MWSSLGEVGYLGTIGAGRLDCSCGARSGIHGCNSSATEANAAFRLDEGLRGGLGGASRNRTHR